MRINKFVALATGMSRRSADQAIQAGRVLVDNLKPTLGQEIQENNVVSLDGQAITIQVMQTILLNKPAGYITSRNGQGGRTIYDLLPQKLHELKPIGRLDKETSGLLLLTNDGNLAQTLTHPSQQKIKIYQVRLDKPLAPLHRQMISDIGIQLEDGLSRFFLERLNDQDDSQWQITMHEGRNRQIRRTFAALGYKVTALNRSVFGSYTLPAALQPGSYRIITPA